MLLLAFPELKSDPGPVTDSLVGVGVENAILSTWKELLSQEMLPEEDDDGY